MMQFTFNDLNSDVNFVNSDMLNSFVVNFDNFYKNTFKIWPTPQSRNDWSVPRFLFVDSKFITRTCSETNVQVVLPKTSGLQNYRTWTGWLYHGLGATLEAITSVIQSRRRSSKSRKHCRIWDSLLQGPIDKAVKKFLNWPKACFEAKGGHFEHYQWL